MSLRFDLKITTGDIIKIGLTLFAIIAAYFTLVSDVKQVKTKMAALNRTQDSQYQSLDKGLDEVKNSVRDIYKILLSKEKFSSVSDKQKAHDRHGNDI